MSADHDFTLMRDFISGRLSDAECRAFEDRLVREPALVRELEQSLRMRAGLHHLRTRGYVHTPRAVRWRLPIGGQAVLAAAAVAAVASFLWLPRWGAAPPLLTATPAAQPSAGSQILRQFTFVRMRGASMPTLELPAAGLIDLRAAPGSRDGVERFRMRLVSQDEQGAAKTIASLSGLGLSTDGYVHCYVEASRLHAGKYLLHVQPVEDAAGAAEVYPFNLRAAAPDSSR